MKEKKNIDRLFQEKFKDFEAHPSDRVWNTIAAAQKQKDKRKVVPFWWKVSGIAAALLLLLSVGGVLVTSNTSEITEVADQESAPQQESTSKDILNEELVSQQNNNIAKEQEEITEEITATNSTSPQLAATSNSTVSQKANLKGGSTLNKSNKASRNKVTTNSSSNNKAIAYNSSVTADQNPAKALIDENYEEKATPNIVKDAPINTEVTTIAETTEEASKKDLTIEAKKIEESKQEDAVASLDQDSNSNKWNVGAVAAPVYYGDFGGSGLDKQFADNDKSGGVNLSYGVQVSYAVTPKLKVRTGINNLNLSYDTNEISFTTSGQGRSLQNVNYAEDVSTLIITDANPSTSTDGFAPQRVGVTAKGSLEQRLSYLEIPMEAVYTISDKRLGLSVIGGVSTLLLNDNQVVLASDQLTTNLGSSTNVNDVSFSTNIGLGLDYKMTDKLQLNLEPSFKYQINGFNEDAVNFRPYYLGVYTGVSYKF